MQGLMQDWPLTVDKILDHAKAWHGAREVVSRSVEGPVVRTTYAQIHERAKRLSNALLDLGIKPGDRVATLAWNTARHIESWYGIMGIGAICHTLNPRLFTEQLCYIINHAEDQIIFTDLTFLPVLLEHREKMPTVKHFVVFTDAMSMNETALPGALCYEDLIARQSADCAWGGFDENTAAGLCYTSGTTGNPKGVLYSHRSNVLHTLITMGTDVLNISARDVILPVVPMFHANAWGLALSAPAAGAKLVMPGQKLDGASVHELLETEGVTFSAAVPTVWQMLLTHLRETKGRLSTLKRVVIGGSAVPEAIVRGFRDDFGVDVTHAWGMTETSPLGTISQPNAAVAAMGAEEQLQYKLKQGRPPLTVELELFDDDNKPVEHDGRSFGKLKVRGPFVAGAYFKGEGGKILDENNFFDTGDVATLDDQGYMQITDRAKDVIKSGGEWISTIEIENIAVGHPAAELAAVIGAAHPKWDERPVLLVKLRPGATATKEDFLRFLDGKIARWWLPDDVVFVDDIPLGATGKIDKKLIRQRMADYVLPTTSAAAGVVALAAPPPPKVYAPEPEPAPDPQPEPLASLAEADEAVPSLEAEAADLEPVAEAPADSPVSEALAEVVQAPVIEPPLIESAPVPDPPEPAAPEIISVVESAPPPPPLPEPEIVEAAPEALPPFPGLRGAEATADLPSAEAETDLGAAPLLMAGATRPARTRVSPAAIFWLNLAIGVAALPLAMVALGAVGASLGTLGLRSPAANFIVAWAPRIALFSVATGVVALVIALAAGFAKLWWRALLAMGLTAVTLGGYLALQTEALTNPTAPSAMSTWIGKLAASKPW